MPMPNLLADGGATPLYMAAQKGHSDTVSILLQANANPNIQSDEGVTPLYVAAQNGHSVYSQYSFTSKCQSQYSRAMNGNITPLYIAVQNGHY